MNSKITDEVVETIRSVIGEDYSELDIIRALHMANNDTNGAINIIFDTPDFSSRSRQNCRINSRGRVKIPSSNEIVIAENNENRKRNGGSACKDLAIVSVQEKENRSIQLNSGGKEWFFVGYGEISGMSTSKGRKIKIGDEVDFFFPLKDTTTSTSTTGKVFGRGKQVKTCSEIVRFSTKSGGEVTVLLVSVYYDYFPVVEEQAVMRIHRIGQTKTVNIKRFIVKGTVEERMEAVQARKQRMIAGALTDQEVRSARIEELKMLFT